MKKVLMLLVALVAVCAFAQDAAVQESNGETVKEGISIGKMVFAPSVEFIYEDNDNIYLTENDEVSDEIYTMRPKLLLELPSETSYLRFGWIPQYRDYADTELSTNWTHFFDAEGTFKTPSGLELKVADHFIKDGTLEITEVDAGSELVYNDAPFDKNTAMLDLKYFFSDTTGFGLYADMQDVDFDDAYSNVAWYDWSSETFGLSFQRYMNPLLRMALGIDYKSFSPDGTVDWREYSGYNYFVQFYGDFTPTVNASIKVGYEDLDFEGTGEDYADWSADANIVWNFADAHNLTMGLKRQAYASNYLDVSSYTNNAVQLTYNFTIVEKFYGSLGGEFGKNEYNDYNRTDDIWGLLGFIGYHFTPHVSARLNLRHEVRDSSEACSQGCDYEVNAVLLNLVVGY
jgi:hypothetical protein